MESMTKSITELIDETLQELEDLKKSRMEAAEIKIKGPGEGIDGKPSDGSLDAKKAEDDEKKKKEDEEAAAKQLEEAKKAEDVAKAEGDKKDDKEPHKDDPKHEDKEKELAEKLAAMHKCELKKSVDESNTLMKSYVEERVKPLEDKLTTILNLVNKIADQPVQAKGVTVRTIPLLKSNDSAVETLSKAQVANKLFELKKSGKQVDSLDVARAEMGQDLANIIKKYEIS